jgi:hypothetical protein
MHNPGGFTASPAEPVCEGYSHGWHGWMSLQWPHNIQAGVPCQRGPTGWLLWHVHTGVLKMSAACAGEVGTPLCTAAAASMSGSKRYKTILQQPPPSPDTHTQMHTPLVVVMCGELTIFAACPG